MSPGERTVLAIFVGFACALAVAVGVSAQNVAREESRLTEECRARGGNLIHGKSPTRYTCVAEIRLESK